MGPTVLTRLRDVSEGFRIRKVSLIEYVYLIRPFYLFLFFWIKSMLPSMARTSYIRRNVDFGDISAYVRPQSARETAIKSSRQGSARGYFLKNLTIDIVICAEEEDDEDEKAGIMLVWHSKYLHIRINYRSSLNIQNLLSY